MKSCIYKGRVNHKRTAPRQHEFSYSLFMMYVDLEELPSLFDSFGLWSIEKSNIASFKRKDHFGDKSESLADSVRKLVLEETGNQITGPIRLLTHFRYFGYIFNPLSLYYCFDQDDQKVEYIVAEVSNTPWKEMHCYVLRNNDPENSFFRARHKKEFHVSPFMDLNMEYQWKLGIPDDSLCVEIQNRENNTSIFSANIVLQKCPINRSSLNQVLVGYPLMTLKVTSAIHFEAFKLWSKGISYVPHPRNH